MITRVLLLLVMLTGAALGAEPRTRNPIPNPELLLESDSFSIAVVQFREDDVALHGLLKAALNSIATGEAKLPPSMAEVSNYLSQNNRADMLIAGLPYQAVRVDRLLPSGKTSPCYASTLSGWRGLQVNLYNSLATGADGKAFPSEFYRRAEMVFREHHEDPTWAGTLCRVNGTFLFTPTPDLAKKIVDRLMPKDKPLAPAAGPLLTAYQALPKAPDGFGVLLNHKGAVSALLKALDNEHIQKIRDKVGSDRLDRAVANTRSAVWQVDVVSEDRAEFQAVLTVDPKEVAEVAAMLEEGKPSLDPTKVVDVSVVPGAGNVTVKLAVVGLKQLLLDTLSKGSVAGGN